VFFCCRYTGRLCSECASGNFRMFDGSCGACGPGSGWFPLLLGCMFFGWLWWTLLSSSKTSFITIRLSIEWAQLMGALSITAAPMPPFLRQHLALMQMFNFSPYFLPWACVIPPSPDEEVFVTILYQVCACHCSLICFISLYRSRLYLSRCSWVLQACLFISAGK
jgi:hypothetical protein